MTEALNRSGPANLELIHLDEPRELAYWAHVLGISEEELEAVVGRVGPRAVDVRRYVSRARRAELQHQAHQAPQQLAPDTQRSGGDSLFLTIACCAAAVATAFGTLAYRPSSADRGTALRHRGACETTTNSGSTIEQARCPDRRTTATVRARLADAADNTAKPLP